MTDRPLSKVLDELPSGPDVPGRAASVAPATQDDVAALMAAATREGASVLVMGAGLHQGYGYRVDADVVLSTSGLRGVVDWEPDDLTLTVGAGTTLDEIDELLAGEAQTAVLPENEGSATAGGVVAAGLSGWRRRRYGPTRDRVIEVDMVTGDGRSIHAGGRVVKNVTGYDISRLATGSFGALGVITSLTFKLWPQGSHLATVRVDDPAQAAAAFRPLAVLEGNDWVRVYVSGTEQEVAGYVDALGGDTLPGLAWPDTEHHAIRLVVRVPPARTSAAVAAVRTTVPGASFVAAHGVGEVRLSGDTIEAGAAEELRSFAERESGAVVVAAAPDDFTVGFDPWGTPPASVELQRKVKVAFDPFGTCNPGRLPGRL